MQRKESSAADDQNETGGSGRLLNRLFSQSISSSLLYTFLKKKALSISEQGDNAFIFFPMMFNESATFTLEIAQLF